MKGSVPDPFTGVNITSQMSTSGHQVRTGENVYQTVSESSHQDFTGENVYQTVADDNVSVITGGSDILQHLSTMSSSVSSNVSNIPVPAGNILGLANPLPPKRFDDDHSSFMHFPGTRLPHVSQLSG